MFIKLRPAPSSPRTVISTMPLSFRAEREIFFVRGETTHKRKAETGNLQSVNLLPSGKLRAKPAFHDAHLRKATPPHRHFGQSEKSFSFAVKRRTSEKRKTGNPPSENLRLITAWLTSSLMKTTGKAAFHEAQSRKAAPRTVISSEARNLFRSR